MVNPAVGSAFPGGHMPLVGFFLVVQFAESEEAVELPFDCVEEAEMVEFEDAEECSEELELVRCAFLRGPGMNIRLMSSELIVPALFCGPLTLFHPVREGGWNDTGGATAVICKAKKVQLLSIQQSTYPLQTLLLTMFEA